MKKRIIYNDNGTLSDLGNELNNYHANESTFSFVALQDYLYIGSNLPFNHLKVNMGTTVNVETSAMTIHVWDGTEWDGVAEVNDETDVSGATLAQSGFVTFVPDKNNGWAMDDTVKADGTTEEITGLGNVKIYDKYWLRISFSADLTAAVNLSWIGQIFSDDNDLKDEFPDFLLTDMLTAFETGKTDWNNQHYAAAKIIVKDLIAKKVIKSGDQILCKEDLYLASVQKVAQIIYNNLGDDYTDQYKAAEKEYKERLSKAYVMVDVDADGRLDKHEQTPFIGRLYR